MAEIFVTQVTKCKDIVQRLQRQIQETDCYLIEVWQGCGRFGVIDAYLYKPNQLHQASNSFLEVVFIEN